MSEFEDRQAELAAAHAEVENQDRALRSARAALERSGRARWLQGRGGENPDAAAELDARIAEHEVVVADRRARLAEARLIERDLVAQFAAVHPRERISNLNDRIPICLVPLRIETRFKPADETDGDTGQLWVRVYPDDFSVDSFEDTPSDTEAQSARAYWAGIWAAGGVEAQERGAWAVMMAGQGAGRSHWITQAYMPLNEADRPDPPENGAWIVLTIPTRAPLGPAEADALRTYWAATWTAGEDLAAQAAALSALEAATNAARAQELRESYIPTNLADTPSEGVARADVQVQVAFLHFPTDEDAGLRLQGWATTPRARLLPDRLVFMGLNDGEVTEEHLGAPIQPDLAVAPDPQAEEDEQIRPDGEDLKVGDEMEWLTDFDRAVSVGMGFRIPLDPVAFRRGFDKVLILGIRLRDDAEEGRAGMEDLISRHHRSKSGFTILPQGRPTNNVESAASDYNWREDPDVSFDHYFGAAPPDPAGWYDKTDGRWLAEMLGLDPGALRVIPHYGRTDICDAKAMNVALWPTTLGYFCDTMLQPVLEDATIRRLRDFFNRHVSARGNIPAIRIGRQPYGILPVTPRSRLRWMAPRHRDPIGAASVNTGALGGDPFLLRLYSMMRQFEGDLEPLLDRVSFIGKPGTADPQQVLLDVLGLHPGSVEFQQRYAESLQQLYNRMRLSGAGGGLLALVIALGYATSGLNLLREYGYDPSAEDAEIPSILEKYFTRAPNNLSGPLIDDVALSETDAIRAYTDTGQNYLAWLREAAATSHDTLRKQEGFADGRPRALLYHMMRHALDLSYVETSVQLFVNAGLMTSIEARQARREPEFIQVSEAALADPAQEAAGNSRWARLYQREATITGVADRRIGDFIPTVMNTMTATAYLSRQLRALDHLSGRPTAALERCFAEHLDLCTYRLDAWYGGLMSAQLEQMRYSAPVDLDGDGQTDRGETGAQTGLYVGAWGYLEDVRPEFKNLEPVRLDGELGAIFNTPDAPPLARDDKNQGYIHAPSLNHAVTAAVLRNGYVSNATPGNPESLAVNLTSERVRMALSIIEGMKADQNLAALLGYQFERGLHDRHDVEVDEFIYDLRKVFPLAGDRLRPTRSGKAISIRKVEARNVIDGLEFVDHLKDGAQDYPFGLGDDLPPASPAQATAISDEAKRLLDIADAVADLAMAESVHQVVQGNYDRAGAVLNTYSKGKFPATPDVIRTPRTGVNLTHRVALHLQVGLDPADAARISPRARCEPALDAWLAGVLPAAARVACVVELIGPDGASLAEHEVSQADLGLAPLDMPYVLDPDDDRAGKALDDMIEAHVIRTHAPRPDVAMTIHYRRRIGTLAGHVPFFELTAMIKPLRRMLLESRPLRPTDMALQDEATETQDVSVSLDPQRIALNRTAMAAARDDLDSFAVALSAQIDADPQPTAQIVTQIDVTADDFVTAILAAQPFAQLEAGTGVIYGDRGRIFAGLQTTLTDRVQRLDDRLAEFDAAIAAFDGDPGAGDNAKFETLILAERLIAATNTDPQPADPDAYRNDLVNTARPAFVAERDALAAIGPAQDTASGLHDAIEARLANLADFDTEPLDLSAHVTGIATLATDMASRAAGMAAEMTTRLEAVDALMTQADSQTDPRRQVEDRTKAAQAIFGDDFQMVPSFALPPLQGAEWRAAWGLGATADRAILSYQETTLGRPFPVDDFMTGFARVRDKIGAFETVTQLTEAFGTADPALQPLQFPHRPDLPWLALDYPQTLPDGSDLVIDEDKLLYTAHYAVPFDETQDQAGLLLDEMTETIPSRTEDTGLTFHYDRPNSEPPQSLLLALPAEFTGAWRWEDLVDSVLETMDLARKRAIEPDHIDTTGYGRFLPAVISAVTLYPLTAALNFSENNNFSAVMANIAQGNSDE
ncbi:hypothetical protein [uncultured Ruegeria sp.]|uniref:hypothetical protein n=1 Tax=uncultured Ruegeria sp. TaxID=259304 RepID=UPI00261575F7|nr:hypothetical protein [uncultured Ruegeria sp.]